ncbi:MAG: zinc ribbon domain-containing protein [archaeon]|nr:zinc ribbon domain-containing protein [archaeon]
MGKNLIIISILFSITILPLIVGASSAVYSITLDYDGEKLTNEGIKIIEGDAPTIINQPNEGFTLKVLSNESEVLYSIKFTIEITPLVEPPPEIFDEQGNQISIPQDEPITPTKTSVVLIVPYFAEASTIEIYDKFNNKLLSIDLSQYNTTGNQNENLGFPDSTLIIVIVLIIILVAGFFVLKNKKLLQGIKKQEKETKNEKQEQKREDKKEAPKIGKFCKNCGTNLEGEKTKFCGNCGKKI